MKTTDCNSFENKNIHKVFIPIYGDTVFIYTGESKEELNEFVYLITESYEMVSLVEKQISISNGLIAYNSTGNFNIMVVPLGSPLEVILHELYHLTTNILLSKGMAHVHESDEAYAYLFSFLVKTIAVGIYKRSTFDDIAIDEDITQTIQQ